MRDIFIEVCDCDDCPLSVYDGYPIGSGDYGWDCSHPEGGFRIVDEGEPIIHEHVHELTKVVARIGKDFPDGCPLLERIDEGLDPFNHDLLVRVVAGAVRNTVKAKGSVGKKEIGSAAKRITCSLQGAWKQTLNRDEMAQQALELEKAKIRDEHERLKVVVQSQSRQIKDLVAKLAVC